MKYIEAAESVLRDVSNKDGLSAADIVKFAIEKGFLKSEGKTPKNSMSACITQHIKKLGDASIFVRTSPGMFALKDPSAVKKRKQDSVIKKSPHSSSKQKSPKVRVKFDDNEEERSDDDDDEDGDEEEEDEEEEEDGEDENGMPVKKRSKGKSSGGILGASADGDAEEENQDEDSEKSGKKKKKISREIEAVMIKKALSKQGFVEQETPEEAPFKDCVYYAFLDQLQLLNIEFKAEDPIKELRNIVKTKLTEDPNFFKSILKVDQKDFDAMVENINEANFADKLDIYILSRYFKRPVFVFKIEIDRVQLTPLKIPIEWSKLTPDFDDDGEPIRFAFHMFHQIPHYTSVRPSLNNSEQQVGVKEESQLNSIKPEENQ